MDNRSVHKSQKVRALIEGKGAKVLFLPSYSPDRSPIEAAWAKLKHLLRKLAPQSVRALRQAIYRSWRKLSVSDVQGWFRYCGYAR